MQVAKALVDLYKQCLAGDFSLIQRLSGVASGAQQSAGFAVRSFTLDFLNIWDTFAQPELHLYVLWISRMIIL